MRQRGGPDFAGTRAKRYDFRIKRSESARGRSNKVAERIAAATTNKTRREKGETK
jgi:hypothetical protein